MSDDAPENHPTAKLSQEGINSALLKKLQDTVEGGFARLTADISIVADDLKVTKDRIILIESRTNELETRMNRNSERAQGASKVDLDHEAAIAALITKVDGVQKSLGENTALTEEVKKILASPMAKRVGQAAVTAAIAGLTYLAAYFQMKGGH